MARSLTSGMLALLAESLTSPVLLVYLDFSGGAVRVWSGIGPLSWGGYTWVGLGDLGGISQVEETTEFRANGIQFQLNGIPSDYVALALGQYYQGRAAEAYLGALNSSGALVADPALIFRGKMDVMQIDEGPEVSSIVVQAESRAVSLKVARERRYTHEDQQIDYPGDKGFEFVPGLQDKDLVWKPA